MQNSNYTGRTHRTLTSAFGPYTDDRIYTEPDYPHAGAIMIICIVAVGIAVWLAV